MLSILFAVVGIFMLVVGIFDMRQFIPHHRMRSLVAQLGHDGVRLMYIVFGIIIAVSGLTSLPF